MERTEIFAGRANEFEDENEPVVVVEIDALRHGKKLSEEIGEEADIPIPLKPFGKLQALCRSFEMDNLDTSVARGSHKLRSRQTAGIISQSGEILNSMSEMFGEDKEQLKNKLKSLLEKMTSNSQLEADKQVPIDEEENSLLDYLGSLEIENIGGFVDEDPRLGFNDGNEPAKSELVDAYNNGKLLEWMAENSDQRAIETQDKDMTTLTRHATNIASILKDYLNVTDDLKTWMKNYGDYYGDIKKDGEYVFKRVFGTHTRINECFLLKVMEKLEVNGQLPEGSREKILEKVPGGIKETEGLRYRVIGGKEGHKVEIILPERIAEEGLEKFEISENLIDEIIEEGKKYEDNFE